jgi:hypothetical protein
VAQPGAVQLEPEVLYGRMRPFAARLWALVEAGKPEELPGKVSEWAVDIPVVQPVVFEAAKPLSSLQRKVKAFYESSQ